jgi:uncharacterized membrane protein YkvA (DUF1232 family)
MRALLITALIATSVWALIVIVLVISGRRLAAREFATFVPNLGALFYGLLRDPRVPRRSKVLLGFGIAWFASPVDLIPEFIPVLGPLDDAVVAVLILRHVLGAVDREVLAEHWPGDSAVLDRMLRMTRRSS